MSLNVRVLSEDDSCPQGLPGSLKYPDPGSLNCRKCCHCVSVKSDENRVHDMCPTKVVECSYMVAQTPYTGDKK